MILHIFKKDCELLWPYVAGFVVLRMIATAVFEMLPSGVSGTSGTTLLDFIWLVIAILALQQDSVEGMRQDWLIRPIARRDMLLAKLLFVLVMILLPCFLIGFIDGWGATHEFAAAVRWSAFQSLFRVAAILPCMAVASVFTSLRNAVVGSVVLALGSYMLTYSNSELLPLHWLVTWMVLAVLMTAAIVALPLTYLWRRRTAAIAMLAGALMFAGVGGALLPYGAWFGFLALFSAERGAARSVVVTPPPGAKPSLGNNSLPLLMSGLPPGSRVYADFVRVRAAGRDVPQPPQRTWMTPVRFVEAPWQDYVTLRVPPPAPSTPPLKADLFLTLMRVSHQYVVPVRRWPGRGDPCFAQSLRARDPEVVFTCEFTQRPDCYTAVLESMPGGQAAASASSCYSNYDPLAPRGIPGHLPLADFTRAGTEEQLASARVVLKIYKPVDHFVRRVEIEKF